MYDEYKKQMYIFLVKKLYEDLKHIPKSNWFPEYVSEIYELFGCWKNFLIEAGLSKCKRNKYALTKKEWIKLLQDKHKELGHYPSIIELDADKRFYGLRTYLHYHKFADLKSEAFNNYEKRKGNDLYENYTENQIIDMLKKEILRMKNENINYKKVNIFNKNRKDKTPIAKTYCQLLNKKSWEDIIEELDKII